MARKTTEKPASKTSPKTTTKKPTAKKRKAKKASARKTTAAKRAPARKAPDKKGAAKEPKVTQALASKHGLSKADLGRAKDRLGRTPTYTELAVLSAMWSEHGCRKSSRSHLAKLPRSGQSVLLRSRGHGVADIGDGGAAVLAVATKNQRSSVTPQEAATVGLSTSIAEVLAAGAKPVATRAALSFGESSRHQTRQHASVWAENISDFRERAGVPVVGTTLCFDDCYDDAAVGNVFSVGVCGHGEILSGRGGEGSLVIYAGAQTRGNEEIVESSDTGAGETEANQGVSLGNLGDPLVARRLTEALRDLAEKDLVRGISALGEAGLTISAVDVAAAAEAGVSLDIDEVPCAEEGMSAYDVLLSNSPDRMLLIADEGRETDILAVFDEHEIKCAVVGRLIDTGAFEARVNGKVVCELSLGLLTAAAPKYDRETRRPTYYGTFLPVELEDLPTDLGSSILDLVGSPNVCERRAGAGEVESDDQPGATRAPNQSAAVLAIPGSDTHLSFSVTSGSRFCFLNPRVGAQHAIAACARSISVTGATPSVASVCLSTGEPSDPEVMWQFVEVVEGLAHGLDMLEIPAIVASADFGNETYGRAIYPTPVTAMLGVFLKGRHVRGSIGPGFSNVSDRVIVLGDTYDELCGSEWAHLNGFLGATPPRLDWQRELAVQALVRQLLLLRRLSSAHLVGGGGLALALAESAVFSAGGTLGVELSIEPQLAPAAWLFSESASRILVSAPLEMVPPVLDEAVRMGVPAAVIGTVRSDTFSWPGHFNVSLHDIIDRYERGLIFNTNS